jgi:hypothetical protein
LEFGRNHLFFWIYNPILPSPKASFKEAGMMMTSHRCPVLSVAWTLLLLAVSALLLSPPFADALSTRNQSSSSPIIPITVLSGFLGTGKTTLLQKMLSNKQGLKIGVIVNDVASVNIDSKLVMRDSNSADSSNALQADGMVELQNGCACCSLSDELLTSVANLVTLSDLKEQSGEEEDGTATRGGGFQHIVIELSGKL